MSEQLNLETNNFCIPEDAFEQFQAVSMYQEEECIILPNTNTQGRNTSELEANHPSFVSNEVVLSSTNNEMDGFEQQPLNSECVESNSLSCELPAPSLDESSFTNASGKLQGTSNSVPHKKDIEQQPLNSQSVESNSLLCELPAPSLDESGFNNSSGNLQGNSNSVPRKRGRKPKSLSVHPTENPILSATPISSDHNTPIKGRKTRGRPRKPRLNGQDNSIPYSGEKDASSDFSSSDNSKNTPSNNSIKRKRGRPKKSDIILPVSNESLGQHDFSESEVNDNLLILEDITSVDLNNDILEKQKSMISNLDTLDMDDMKVNPDFNKNLDENVSNIDDDLEGLDDICLSKLKTVAPDKSIGDFKGKPSKLKKKRGRSKKKSSQSQLVEHTEVLSDELPLKVYQHDMSVSKLNSTPDDTKLSETNKESTKCSGADTQQIKEINNSEDQICQTQTNNIKLNPTKRNTKVPVMEDFEYNIDSVLGSENTVPSNENNLLIEDISKRPVRQNAKKFKYDVESDEDPFANVELSDDEPRRGRKGNKYYSDDEYIPGKRGNEDLVASTDTELSDGEEKHMALDENKKQRRRKLCKKSDTQSPQKKNKKDNDLNTTLDKSQNEVKINDSEISSDLGTTKTNDNESQPATPSQKWGSTKEFENFLAKKIQGTNLKIKKVSANVSVECNKIEIPVLDPKANKTIEMCTQTSAIPTSSKSVQTGTPYDIPMKENITLTSEQSEKACSFLNSIVKTTAELGTLMTQKSEDFIKKKINTSHVTDTFKMDYCVRKSFLLFKLAKHNLMQMEEDLSKQYEQFLDANNLAKCREELKKVLPTLESDSDCEIVEVKPSPQTKTVNKKQTKAAFNPKTVFLNKELSIKIAKKTGDNKKLDIKGRHTVWINDTVMVKKVKPTQSFLAQDSRNKKPPDNLITIDMVRDFFRNYYRQKVLSTCAPFVSANWMSFQQIYVCNYFVVKPIQCITDATYNDNGLRIRNNESTVSQPSPNISAKSTAVTTPDSLFALCVHIVRQQLFCEEVCEFNEDKQTSHELTNMIKIPKTLFRLSLDTINSITNTNEENNITQLYPIIGTPTSEVFTSEPNVSGDEPEVLTDDKATVTVCHNTLLPLKSLCHIKIVSLLSDHNKNRVEYHPDSLVDVASGLEKCTDSWHLLTEETEVNESRVKSLSLLCLENIQGFICVIPIEKRKNGVKSLFTLCVKYVQSIQHTCDINKKISLAPQSLKKITFENVKHLLYSRDLVEHSKRDVIPEMEGLMINCVNTLSEEAFLNLEQYNTDMVDDSNYLDDFDNEDNYEQDLPDCEDDQTVPSWVSQVQMQEPISCVNTTNAEDGAGQVIHPIITQIKLEPLDDVSDNLVAIKMEPPGPDEMTIIPHVKPEIDENLHRGSRQRQNSSSYDGEAFEHFVNNNKIMRSLSEDFTDEIYSQSSARIRRQHVPDHYDENNPDMLGLLVPHTYEPMTIQTAKGHLMESSSDESTKNVKTSSKKVVKRSRGRPKKSDQKSNNKDIPTVPSAVPALDKDKQKGLNNELATLNRRMKDKIRQEEKKNESSDSESENISLGRLRSREKKDDQNKEKKDTSEQQSKEKIKSKNKTNEIQCNNVDSTDQLEESLGTFTGFTSIETNEMSNYEKYMKFVYDKVVPEKENEIQREKELKESKLQREKELKESKLQREKELKESKLQREKELKENGLLNKDMKCSETPVVMENEPVELLECEPTLPLFDEDINRKTGKKVKVKGVDPKSKNLPNDNISKNSNIVSVVKNPPFVDRYGWECYPVDSGDSKLYQNACVYLEKLPSSFVQTYFTYQDIANKDKSDEEINRLTNLNSLNRTHLRDRKAQNSSKKDSKDKTGLNSDDEDHTDSVHSDHYDELQPSDDEGPRIKVESLSPVMRQTDNCLAKNSLMNDKESDEEGGDKVKLEMDQNGTDIPRSKRSSKTKVAIKSEEPSDLMLTADKMMNKELTLLHAPVVLDQNVQESTSKDPPTKHTKKSGTRSSHSSKVKAEEDSSSEEEKQWVSTKEKLLKRIGQKDTSSADDAKRAKLVSEFIERRETKDSHKRVGVRTRRSGKKFLERQKQLRVLQRELFGEMSNDPTVKRSGTAWKGRRNIRKANISVDERETIIKLHNHGLNVSEISKQMELSVLDKKSLARSTVVANMEEFERKRRLNLRQTKLRELLGCEEGVNVLVINDEVCLEYDFEEHRPLVTIHPFFTKVMKAHQYEGVKFMWDACFESLADIESGHTGGGCILAHCMGLGKTLQVLALLHTVLTHPRVGMQRILVCCPLSTVLNWVDEIHKWIGPVTNKIKVFELSKLKKTYERAYQLEDWYNGGGIFIIGYELFRSLSTIDPELDDVRPTIVNKIRTALLEPGPDIIVCDEGHLLKNDCSVLAVSMSRVVTKRRIVLTGTPMQNNLREYYCMVNFVKPNLLGTYSEYSNRFENPIMNGQHRDSSEEDIKLMKARTHILHKVLEGCLQRQEVSVLYPYLPKKHEYTVFITLTKCQWDLYKHYLNNYSRQNKQMSILKDFHILQKIWSHPQVLHNFQTKAKETRNKLTAQKLEDDLAKEDELETKEELATDLWWLPYLQGGDMLDSLEVSNKFVVVFRILDECVALGDKVLIFSTSLFCLDALEFFLKKINKWSLGQEYYRLDGSVPAEVRQKWCREFNAENNVNTKLFLISTRAGCLGLNMTAASRVIILDTSWNPAHDIQSIFRVYRFGQKKDCYIYRLVALGTMEQKIYERAVTKQAVACRVVDEQQIDRHYNMAELTELYKYDETGVGVAGGVAAGVRDVALLRVARHTALHAVHEHDSLLRSSEQGLPEHERNAAWMQFQQEQTHKQMENKLITNIPKISLKRVQGSHYERTLVLNDNKIKTEEVETDNTSANFVVDETSKRGIREKKITVAVPTFTELPTGKRRPGRPPKKIAEPLELVSLEVPGPSSQQTQDDQSMEDMVCEITKLLIKHNFKQRRGKTDLSNLVARVRRMVARGYIMPEDGVDGLTTSIANVLIQKNKAKAITGDSINNIIIPNVLTEPEHILGTSDDVIIPETRRKRKAAITAYKYIDSMAQNVTINLDDDDDADPEFVPNETDDIPDIIQTSKRKYASKPIIPSTIPKLEPKKSNWVDTPHCSVTNINETEPTSILGDRKVNIVSKSKPKPSQDVNPPVTGSKSKIKPGPKAYKDRLNQKSVEEPRNVEQTSNVHRNSISVSDDDNEPLSNIDLPVANTTADTTAPISDDSEVIPLPLSLLTNKNFINIVAHTYLNGNPMLDSDAATLAAQYSTFKSLKEVEDTGKDITSGPIYDIAVKVIGKHLFKKMNITNVKTSKVDEADVTIELRKKMQAMANHKSKNSNKQASAKRNTDLAESVTAHDIELDFSEPQLRPSGNVVPVGLIQPTGSIQLNEYASSESILPDDDDTHIVPYELPALPKLQPAPTLPPKVITRPKRWHRAPPAPIPTDSTPIMLTPITKEEMFAAKPTNVIKISNGKVIIPSKVTSGASANVKSTPERPQQSTTNVICLDSDDEENITPSLPTPQASVPPVPQSLTVAHGSSLLGKPSGDIGQKSNFVIRQVSTSGASKFVLIPSTSLPIPKLPNDYKPIEIPVPELTSSITGHDTIASKSNKISKPEYIKIKPKPNITPNTTPTKPILLNSKASVGYTIKSITPSKTSITLSNPIVATKANTTKPESILPTATVKQARCKPGDIIKISDTGEIQVLQSKHSKSNNLKTQKSSGNIKEAEKPKSSQNDVAKSRSSHSDIEQPKYTSEPSTSKSASKYTSEPSTSKSASKYTSEPSTSKSASKYTSEPSTSKSASKYTSEPSTSKSASKYTSEPSTSKSASKYTSEPSTSKSASKYTSEPSTSKSASKYTSEPSTSKGASSLPTVKPIDVKKYVPKKTSGTSLKGSTKSGPFNISSSSSEWRAHSPVDDNPLSILKNVVHIQAAEDTPSTSNDKLKTPNPEKSVLHRQKQKTNTSNHKTPSTSKEKPKTSIPEKRGCSDIDRQKQKTNTSNSKTPTTPNPGRIILTLGSKDLLAMKSKNIGNPSSVIDITSNDFNSLLKTSTASASGSKAVASKSNMQKNKPADSIDLTNIPTVMSGSGSSILMTKIEAKKRLSTGETSAPKKKKSELRLEDFSLDDIDDIIELD